LFSALKVLSKQSNVWMTTNHPNLRKTWGQLSCPLFFDFAYRPGSLILCKSTFLIEVNCRVSTKADEAEFVLKLCVGVGQSMPQFSDPLFV